MEHLQPQAIEFMEKEIVLASERYLGKSVFPQKLEGTDIGAYLLVTFDGDDMEALEEITEKAAEVVLEAGAIDVNRVYERNSKDLAVQESLRMIKNL